MRHIREILRQKWVQRRSHRAIAESLGLSVGAIGKTSSRAVKSGLTWDAVASLSDTELLEKLYGKVTQSGADRVRPDCAYLHRERSKPGVTLELLHLEYLEKYPNGLKYTQFCEDYRKWLKKQKLSMRQIHRAGEKLYVDYAGKKPKVLDPKTGELRTVELFVAVLGASSYTYAEATRTQSGKDFVQSHIRAFEFFGGVPKCIVPDQLKSGVATPCHYEPEIQRTYESMAQHYGTAVFPARPRHPKDKAKVEVGVQVVERWILARLRNRVFTSLSALNEAISVLLEDLNQRTMRTYKKSRRALFEALDKPALAPLPSRPFFYGAWKEARVHVDYHIEIHGHYYSVPHRYVGEKVEAWVTQTTVEIFHQGLRLASHIISTQRGRHTTIVEHMPKQHQSQMAWSPARLCHWARRIGPKTEALVSLILARRPVPEMGYRSCLGILRLQNQYGGDRLERAADRAIRAGATSYRHVKNVLKNGLDEVDSDPEVEPTAPIDHENIRGAHYYH